MKPDPSKSILNQDWKYVPSGQTDVRATMRRAMKQIAEASKAKIVPITQPRKERQ